MDVSRQPAKKPNNALLIAVGVVWLVAIIGGFNLLLRYETKAGTQAQIPQTWPEAASFARQNNQFTLTMFIHPQCPCTQASLSELAVLCARCPQLKPFIVVIRPAGFPASWEKTTLWRQASAIKGATVMADQSGEQARRFGVQTSGHSLLYSPTGKLVFSGGITSGRGHEGDNAGMEAIQALTTGGQAATHSTAVFGCSLLDDPAPNGGAFGLCRN